MSVLWLFASAGLLCLLQAWLFRWVGTHKVGYERYFSKREAFTGETVEMVEVLVNSSRLPVPWLRVQARVPAALRFGAQSMEEISGQLYHRSFFYLRPRSRLTRRHRVTLERRGCYRVKSVALSTGDLLGSQPTEKTLESDAHIFVYPRLADERELPIQCSRFLSEMLTRRFLMPDPYLVNGVRPYQPGDPPKDISWTATAHTGELRVKTHDFSIDPKLMVVLNVQRSEHQWADLSDVEREPIERGISLAAGICASAITNGAEAGFCANTDLESDGGAAYLAPARSEGQKQELLTLMSRMTLKMKLNFYAYLEQLTPPEGTTNVLILSCVDSERIQAQVWRLRQLGYDVLFTQLEGGARNG